MQNLVSEREVLPVEWKPFTCESLCKKKKCCKKYKKKGYACNKCPKFGE